MIVTQRIHIIGDLEIAAGAGVGGEALLGAGGSGDLGPVAVALGGDDLAVAVAAGAGIDGLALGGTGGLGGLGTVAVAQGMASVDSPDGQTYSPQSLHRYWKVCSTLPFAPGRKNQP